MCPARTGSEPRRNGGATGPQNPNGPGVPSGGTGPGGCYYSCSVKSGWVKSQTPVTNNAQRLRDLFYEYGPNGRFPDGTYWKTPIVEESGTNNVCFGREGCRLAYKFLLKSDDVAEAKRIAANYCVQNFERCLDDAKSYERGKRWESLAYAFIPGGRAGKGAAAADCMCFLAGTDVLMADGATKDIEDVAVGDMVQAADPTTGETGPRKVTRLIRTESDKHFNELSITTENGVDRLTATHEHPFWSPSEQDWIEAGDLKPGMTLLTDEGDTVIVTGNRPFTKHARTYNLTVEDLHTYYVLAGVTPILVHNSNGCGVARNEKGQFTSGENADAARGRQTHLNYRNALGAGYDFEVTLPSGLRPDAVDWKNRVVRELKSDAKSSQATGRRQLQNYVAELEDMTGQSWTGHLDTYKRFG